MPSLALTGRRARRHEAGGSAGRSWVRVAVLSLWSLAPDSLAGRNPELKFLKTVDLPEAGLQIRLMPEAAEMPQPSPSTVVYTFTRGAENWRQEMHPPAELWRSAQHAGAWVDRFDNRLALASVKTPLPRDFKLQHVSRDEFSRAAAALARDPSAWTLEDLSRWVADFAGCDRAVPERLIRRPLRLADLIQFTLVNGPPGLIAYAFRLNRAAAGQHRAPENWFAVSFTINRQIPPETVRRAIAEQFFGYLTTAAGAPPRPADPTRGFQNPDARVSNGRESPDFLASREQARASIRNLNGWWFAETAHYLFLSNLPTRHRAMIQHLQVDVEVLRDAYARFLPMRAPAPAVSVIRVFAEPQEYVRYVGPEFEWTTGLWIPMRKELVVRSVDWGGTREQRDRILKAIYHEAFHQYAFVALDTLTPSAWFNEGFAALFENSEIRNGRLTTDEDPTKVECLRQMIASRAVDLPSLLRLSYAQFYSVNNETMRKQNYSLAWALAYFLAKAAPLTKASAPFASVPGAYAGALLRLRDPDRATAEAFAGVDMNRLASEFLAFWESRNRRSAARRAQTFQGEPH